MARGYMTVHLSWWRLILAIVLVLVLNRRTIGSVVGESILGCCERALGYVLKISKNASLEMSLDGSALWDRPVSVCCRAVVTGGEFDNKAKGFRRGTGKSWSEFYVFQLTGTPVLSIFVVYMSIESLPLAKLNWP